MGVECLSDKAPLRADCIEVNLCAHITAVFNGVQFAGRHAASTVERARISMFIMKREM